MKIYKCCSPNELENNTREGWMLEQILCQDKPTNVPHSAPAQVTNASSGCYTSTTVPVETPVVIREPIFLLSKGVDAESREIQLRRIIANIEAQHKEHLSEHDKVKRERDSYKDEADRRTKALQESVGIQRKLMTVKEKLEGDMAKVRQAIGDLKYFEIVGGPTSTK